MMALTAGGDAQVACRGSLGLAGVPRTAGVGRRCGAPSGGPYPARGNLRKPVLTARVP